MTTKQLYPLTFKPLLKSIIWGGQDIRPFKGLAPDNDTIGESWEISHVPNNFSVVAQGALEGQDLDQIITKYGAQLVGEQVLQRFGQRFPLLIKFIDAQQPLSLQVHPNDKLAQARHNSFGKTEMWYIVKASPEAKLYSGFKHQSSPQDYVQRIENNSIEEVLQEYNVKAGDVFYLPAGRVHAIGAGCFVAEIQQTSDITYRIYDYDRTDAQGNKRELHTELAKDAIDYQLEADYQTHYKTELNMPTHLVTSPYFETNLLHLSQPLSRDWSKLDSFVIYIVMEGRLILKDDQGYEVKLQQGQSVLVPAITQHLELCPLGECRLLETYIPSV